MKKIKRITDLTLTALIVVQAICMTHVSAEDLTNSNVRYYTEEPEYYNDITTIVGTSEDDTNKPDLAALAEEYGYNDYSFNFTNFRADERMTPEVYNDIFDKIRYDKFSSEEKTHGTVDLMMIGGSGCCYGMSAIPVLIHNGIIKASDLQEGAETLNDIVFDEEIGKIILEYAFSQAYQAVQFANLGDYCMKTDEDCVIELLDLDLECEENGKNFQIAYGIESDEKTFNHAVAGIGTTKGEWMFNDVEYNTCILTYDSNRATKEDNTVAGEFTPDLCIYINSDTNQFCIPGYELNSENGGFIFYATDSSDILSYRSDINGTYSVGKDISNLASVYRFSRTKGSSMSAWNGEEYITIDSQLDSYFLTPHGKKVFFYPSTHYIIEQRNSAENANKTNLDGQIWGEGYCTRYGAGNGYDYIVDASLTEVSVKALDKTLDFDSNGNPIGDEMIFKCGLSDDCTGGYYYYFWGTAAENETVKMMFSGKDVIITSDDGTLKGTLLIKDCINKRPKNQSESDDSSSNDTFTSSYIEYTINAANGVYVKVNDMATKDISVTIDKDGDSVYETPLVKGDTNGDGEITIDDATEVLKYYAELSAGLAPGQVQLNPTYPLSTDTADMDGDKKIDISDATLILEMYAKKAAGIK